MGFFVYDDVRKKLGDGETPAEGEKVAYPRVPEISISARMDHDGDKPHRRPQRNGPAFVQFAA